MNMFEPRKASKGSNSAQQLRSHSNSNNAVANSENFNQIDISSNFSNQLISENLLVQSQNQLKSIKSILESVSMQGRQQRCAEENNFNRQQSFSPIRAVQRDHKCLNTETRLQELVEERRQNLFSNHFSKSYNYNVSSQKLVSSAIEEDHDPMEESNMSEIPEVFNSNEADHQSYEIRPVLRFQHQTHDIKLDQALFNEPEAEQMYVQPKESEHQKQLRALPKNNSQEVANDCLNTQMINNKPGSQRTFRN